MQRPRMDRERAAATEQQTETSSPPDVKTAADMGAILSRAGLTAEEVSLLSQVLFDGLTQAEIGQANGLPRTTVALRLRIAFRKLQNAGINVASPPKGRRPGEHRTTRLPPSMMRRLVFRDQPYGPAIGRWVDAAKQDWERN